MAEKIIYAGCISWLVATKNFISSYFWSDLRWLIKNLKGSEQNAFLIFDDAMKDYYVDSDLSDLFDYIENRRELQVSVSGEFSKVTKASSPRDFKYNFAEKSEFYAEYTTKLKMVVKYIAADIAKMCDYFATFYSKYKSAKDPENLCKSYDKSITKIVNDFAVIKKKVEAVAKKY